MGIFSRKAKKIEKELILTKEEERLLFEEDTVRKELANLESKDIQIEKAMNRERAAAKAALEKGDEQTADAHMNNYARLSISMEKNILKEVKKNKLRTKLERIRLAKIKKGIRGARS